MKNIKKVKQIIMIKFTAALHQINLNKMKKIVIINLNRSSETPSLIVYSDKL